MYFYGKSKWCRKYRAGKGMGNAGKGLQDIKGFRSLHGYDIEKLSIVLL